MDPVSAPKQDLLSEIKYKIYDEVRDHISNTLSTEFADINLTVQDIEFRVHSVVISQKPGLLQILANSPDWLPDNTVIHLKTYHPIEIAGALLILYGLKNTQTFKNLSLIAEKKINKAWNSLYPLVGQDEVGIKDLFHLKDYLRSDLIFTCESDNSSVFVHKVFVAAKSSKLRKLMEIYKSKTIFFKSCSFAIGPLRAIMEFLYHNACTTPLNPEDLDGLIRCAETYLDNPKECITHAFDLIYPQLKFQENAVLIEVLRIIKNQSYIPTFPYVKEITKWIVFNNYYRSKLSMMHQMALEHLDLRGQLTTNNDVEKTLHFVSYHPHIKSIDLRSTPINDKQLYRLIFLEGLKNVTVDSSCKNLSERVSLLFSSRSTEEKLQNLFNTPLEVTDLIIEKFFELIKDLDKIDQSKYKHKLFKCFDRNQEKISDRGIRVLGENMGEKLHTLSLENNLNITKEGFKTIVSLFPNLKTLRLCIFQEKGEFNLCDMLLLNHLPELKKLNFLTLGSLPPHDLHVVADTVKKMPNLKSLKLTTLPFPQEEVRLNPLFALNIPIEL